MNAFLSNVPGLLGVHGVGLGRLGLAGQVVGRRQRRVLGLLRLRRGRRVRPLRLGERLDVLRDLGEGGVALRLHAGRLDRRLQQLLTRERGRLGRGTAAAATERRARAARRPARRRPASAPLAAALPSGLFAGTGFGGGTGFFGATWPGPKPVVVTASAEAGGRTPSRSTGMPRFLAALSPFSSASTSGSSFLSSRSPPSISDRAWSAGPPQPRGHEGADGRVARRPLHRHQGARTRGGECPRRLAPAPREGVADRGSRSVGRLACAAHASSDRRRAAADTRGGQARPGARPRARTGTRPLRRRRAEAVHWSHARAPQCEPRPPGPAPRPSAARRSRNAPAPLVLAGDSGSRAAGVLDLQRLVRQPRGLRC